MDFCIEELLSILPKYGYQGRAVSIEHLSELRQEIEGRFDDQLFDEEFYKLRLTFFDFKVPETLPDANCLIVLAIPRPQAQATFTFQGKGKSLILPPTYVAYKKPTDQAAKVLTRILKRKGIE